MDKEKRCSSRNQWKKWCRKMVDRKPKNSTMFVNAQSFIINWSIMIGEINPLRSVNVFTFSNTATSIDGLEIEREKEEENDLMLLYALRC